MIKAISLSFRLAFPVPTLPQLPGGQEREREDRRKKGEHVTFRQHHFPTTHRDPAAEKGKTDLSEAISVTIGGDETHAKPKANLMKYERNASLRSRCL